MENLEILKVKKSSPSKKLGKFIYMKILEEGNIALQVIGAGAVSQAVKAVIEANKLLASKAQSVSIVPSFEDIVEEDFTTTGIRLYLIKSGLIGVE